MCLSPDPRVQEVLNQLINGFLNGVTFQTIYDSLLLHNDAYFVLKDFGSYADIQQIASNAYRDQENGCGCPPLISPIQACSPVTGPSPTTRRTSGK